MENLLNQIIVYLDHLESVNNELLDRLVRVDENFSHLMKLIRESEDIPDNYYD